MTNVDCGPRLGSLESAAGTGRRGLTDDGNDRERPRPCAAFRRGGPAFDAVATPRSRRRDDGRRRRPRRRLCRADAGRSTRRAPPILVDPRDSRATNFDSVLPGLGTDSAAIASQVSVIESRDLLSRVFDELHLANDPEYARRGLDGRRHVAPAQAATDHPGSEVRELPRPCRGRPRGPDLCHRRQRHLL